MISCGEKHTSNELGRCGIVKLHDNMDDFLVAPLPAFLVLLMSLAT